jgi:hypothetical protein
MDLDVRLLGASPAATSAMEEDVESERATKYVDEGGCLN